MSVCMYYHIQLTRETIYWFYYMYQIKIKMGVFSTDVRSPRGVINEVQDCNFFSSFMAMYHAFFSRTMQYIQSCTLKGVIIFN